MSYRKPVPGEGIARPFGNGRSGGGCSAGIHHRGHLRFRWRFDRYAIAGVDAWPTGGRPDHRVGAACCVGLANDLQPEGNILTCGQMVGAGVPSTIGPSELFVCHHASADIY